MLNVTIHIKGIDTYRECDRIRVMADAINTIESWLYSVAGEASIDVNNVTTFGERDIIGTVNGTFDSLVSPYMFEVLDRQVGELKNIWTAEITCEISGA